MERSPRHAGDGDASARDGGGDEDGPRGPEPRKMLAAGIPSATGIISAGIYVLPRSAAAEIVEIRAAPAAFLLFGLI
jgi:hypothetical protein